MDSTEPLDCRSVKVIGAITPPHTVWVFSEEPASDKPSWASITSADTISQAHTLSHNLPYKLSKVPASCSLSRKNRTFHESLPGTNVTVFLEQLSAHHLIWAPPLKWGNAQLKEGLALGHIPEGRRAAAKRHTHVPLLLGQDTLPQLLDNLLISNTSHFIHGKIFLLSLDLKLDINF